MIQYTSVDRILAIINRELGEANSFSDDDIIEWVGEAMGFLSVYPILEENVSFIKIKNNKGRLPSMLANILSVYKVNDVVHTYKCIKKEEIEVPNEECLCSEGTRIEIQYKEWNKTCTKKEGLTPVRLADNALLKTLVCKESNYKELYKDTEDEYTVVGTESKEIVTSFKEGTIALSYTATMTDDNGYPLIPDQADFIAAVTYYIKWKISEAMTWRGREGFSNMMQYNRQEWLRYVKQAKNWAKMPKSLEEWQYNLENAYNLIPNLFKYGANNNLPK